MSLMPLSPEPLILGHRGASAVAPENTLAAFSMAIQEGADGIEFDVRLARDNVPVVIHDANLKRTGLIDGIIAELTGAQLQATDVGSWFTHRRAPEDRASQKPSYAGERLPTLAQVFGFFSSHDGILYVEMKCDAGTQLAAEVVKLSRQTSIADRVVVESFELSAIAEVKRIDAGIRTAALFEPRLSRPISSLRRLRMIDLAHKHGADEIALHHTLAGPVIVEKARKSGLEVVVWTVDDVEWIARARFMGIKALISNDPGRMVRHRNKLENIA